jgi:uncharacterized membrane protein (DUF2068 family)
MSAPTTRVAPWEDFMLRVIAIYKLSHAAFFIAVGFGLLKLRHHNIVDFLNAHLIVPYHINPESHFVDWLLNYAHKLTPWLSLAGYAAFIYATLFAVEGVGLYLRKRWAEWLVVGATGSFLPFELWALFEHAVWWKLALLLGNLLIVSYLVHRILLDEKLKRGDDGPGGQATGGDRPGTPSGMNGSRQTPDRVSPTGAVSGKTP